MKVVTSLYGNREPDFTEVLLESLAVVGYRDPIVVIDKIRGIKTVSSNPRYIVVNRDFNGDRVRLVASKLIAWNCALDTLTNGDEALFLDDDTLVLKPVSVFNCAFDVGYTVRTGRWPINSGVVFLRVNEKTRKFMRDWLHLCQNILNDDVKIKLAIRTDGAPDQAALRHNIDNADRTLIFNPLSCDLWNCVDCPKDAVKPFIMHLKGCLGILKGERPYGPAYGDEREPVTCEPFFDMWRNYRDLIYARKPI